MADVGEEVMCDQTQIAQREGMAFWNKFNLSPSAVPIEYITSRDSDIFDLELTVVTLDLLPRGALAWFLPPRPLICCFLTYLP